MQVEQSRLEIGGDLYILAEKARKWFEENNVGIPNGAVAWQKASVRKGEIPEGTNITSLRKYGITARVFLNLINKQNPEASKYQFDKITKDNSEKLLGIKILKYIKRETGHRDIEYKCCNCGFEETMCYGNLERMLMSDNKFCRICREAGGKEKPLEYYNVEGFITMERAERNNQTVLIYKCVDCLNTITRVQGYANQAEYLVCEVCNPRVISGAKISTDLGTFDSKIEYLAYKKLLELIPKDWIRRQVKYDELFSTGTKHTADFYIEKLDLVLEVTTSTNKLAQSYHDTLEWKLALSNKVEFAYSIKEVEDIVRPRVKALGLTVSNC